MVHKAMTACKEYRNNESGSFWMCFLGGLVALVSTVVILLATLRVTGIVTSLGGIQLPRRIGWPMVMLLVGMVLLIGAWPKANSPIHRRCQSAVDHLATLWRAQGLLGRLVLCALIGQGAISLAYAFELPANLNEVFLERAKLTTTPVSIREGDRYVHWEFFIPQWKKTIPSRASLAYRGQWEGPLVAYELYPRRLYLLPNDAQRLAANWNNHRWLAKKTRGKSLHDRWVDEYWFERSSWPTFDLKSFIQERGITFLLTFDEADEKTCSLLRIPDFSEDKLRNDPSAVRVDP